MLEWINTIKRAVAKTSHLCNPWPVEITQAWVSWIKVFFMTWPSENCIHMYFSPFTPNRDYEVLLIHYEVKRWWKERSLSTRVYCLDFFFFPLMFAFCLSIWSHIGPLAMEYGKRYWNPCLDRLTADNCIYSVTKYPCSLLLCLIADKQVFFPYINLLIYLPYYPSRLVRVQYILPRPVGFCIWRWIKNVVPTGFPFVIWISLSLQNKIKLPLQYKKNTTASTMTLSPLSRDWNAWYHRGNV